MNLLFQQLKIPKKLISKVFFHTETIEIYNNLKFYSLKKGNF